jgi:membrane protein DedA with SNARE-associated domain
METGFTTILFGSALLREMAIIPAAIVSTEQEISAYLIFFASVIGMTINDTAWFAIVRYVPNLFAKTGIFGRMLTKRKLPQISSPLLLLIASNIAEGIRLLRVLYLSRSNLNWSRIVGAVFVSNIIWCAVLVYLGRSLGQTLADILPIYQQITVGFVIVFTLYVLTRKLFTMFLKESK